MEYWLHLQLYQMGFSTVLSRIFIKVDVYEVGYYALQNILKFLTSKLFINTEWNSGK